MKHDITTFHTKLNISKIISRSGNIEFPFTKIKKKVSRLDFKKEKIDLGNK